MESHNLPVKCTWDSECDEGFKDDVALAKHIYEAHGGPYLQCFWHGEAFASAAALQDHYASHNYECLNEERLEPKVRPVEDSDDDSPKVSSRKRPERVIPQAQVNEILASCGFDIFDDVKFTIDQVCLYSC